MSMGNLTGLHAALQSAIDTPGTVTKSQLVALLNAHPQPEAPAEEDLVIFDGVLSVDLKECTCVASSINDICGSAHEYSCGLEPLADIGTALKNAAYHRGLAASPFPLHDQN